MDAPVVPRPDVVGEPDRLGVVHVLGDIVTLGSDGVDEEEIDIGLLKEFAACRRDILPRIGGVGDRDAVVLEEEPTGVDRRVVHLEERERHAEEIEGFVDRDRVLLERQKVEVA